MINEIAEIQSKEIIDKLRSIEEEENVNNEILSDIIDFASSRLRATRYVTLTMIFKGIEGLDFRTDGKMFFNYGMFVDNLSKINRLYKQCELDKSIPMFPTNILSEDDDIDDIILNDGNYIGWYKDTFLFKNIVPLYYREKHSRNMNDNIENILFYTYGKYRNRHGKYATRIKRIDKHTLEQILQSTLFDKFIANMYRSKKFMGGV